MELLSQTVQGYVANSSLIRRMFEAGIELKKKYGPENVYDFSLGNPDLPAPKEVVDGLKAFADKAHEAFAFGYTPNAGAPWASRSLPYSPGRCMAWRVSRAMDSSFFCWAPDSGTRLLTPGLR